MYRNESAPMNFRSYEFHSNDTTPIQIYDVLEILGDCKGMETTYILWANSLNFGSELNTGNMPLYKMKGRFAAFSPITH